MQLPAPEFPPQASSEPPAMVRVATREDVQWNRRIFKAPPLELHPQAFDATLFAQEFPRLGLNPR